MTNDLLPSRRPVSWRIRMLSVIGLAVVIGVLVWNSGLINRLGQASAGDQAPVVSGSGAPSAPRPSRPPSDAGPGRTQPGKAQDDRSLTPGSDDPGVDETSAAGLTATLARRLERATAAASDAGVTISITSARRSSAKQARLFADAVRKYGSPEAASRWVLPPEESAHVKGRAVDIGPRDAMRWLDENGWRYGLCRRYDNEPWHFEATTRPGHHCPPREPYAGAK
jgi:zinc D-Ala-D-Ala carboxypeptidase